jgi:short-subunit dehydrogenase
MNILITGTSSGLGFGLAEYYLKNNHNVFGISRKQNPELGKHSNFKFLSQDISHFIELKPKVAALLEKESKMDLPSAPANRRTRASNYCTSPTKSAK